MRITIGGTRLLCLQSSIISNGFISQLIISYSWGGLHLVVQFTLGSLIHTFCWAIFVQYTDLHHDIFELPTSQVLDASNSPPSFHTSHPAHAASTAKTAAVKAIGLRQGAGSNGEYTHSMAIFIRKINEHWVILQWNQGLLHIFWTIPIHVGYTQYKHVYTVYLNIITYYNHILYPHCIPMNSISPPGNLTQLQKMVHFYMNYLLKNVVFHRFIAMLDHKKVSMFIIWVPTCAIRAEPKTPPSAGLAAARVARPNQPGRF